MKPVTAGEDLSRQAVFRVGATFESAGQPAEDMIEHRSHERAERRIPELVFGRDLDARAARFIAKRPVRSEALERAVEIDDANPQTFALKHVAGGEAFADRPQSDLHLGDQRFHSGRAGGPSTDARGKTKGDEFRIAFEIGDEIEHIDRRVANATRAVKRWHAGFASYVCRSFAGRPQRRSNAQTSSNPISELNSLKL